MTENTATRRRYAAGDRVVAIVNPNTRTDSMRARGALGQWVPDGVRLEIWETRRDVPTSELARRVIDGADGVIAVGGDGTVSEVAAALNGTGIPLSIVPAGSTNIIAQELGIPSSISSAAALAFGPFDLHEIDVGVCNGSHFLHMAGTGIDSRLFEMTDDNLKRRIGWVAYVPAALRAVWDSAHRYRITIDDEEHAVTSPLVLVANGSSIITSSFKIDDSIRSDDGKLDVLVITATKPHEFAMIMAQAAANQISESRYVIQRQAKRIRIESDTPQPVQLDGDVAEQTPAEFSILPKALTIAVSNKRRD